MEAITTFRGRIINKSDIDLINRIIEAHLQKSRRFISQEVCRVWNWRQPNGHLKDMICRSLLLLLESKGFIKLPARKCTPPNPLANRKKPEEIPVDQSSIQCPLKQLLPVSLHQVRRTTDEKLFNSLIEHYHYLGYTQPVGEHLKYIAFANRRPIACLAWCSAPWYIGARDRFIGWTPQIRQENLHLMVTNTRFLILPWVQVPHLASHLLALCRHRISKDWKLLYNHPIYLLETFVDTTLFAGICYKADNWIYLGTTTGLGKLSTSKKPALSKKAVWVYPITGNFRKKLTATYLRIKTNAQGF